MRTLLALFVIAGCTSDRTFEVPEVQAHGAITQQYPDHASQKVDVLLVIDDSPAMAPFDPWLRETLDTVAQLAAERLQGVRADVHVGMVTADLGDGTTDDRVAIAGSCHGVGDGGTMRRSALVDGAYMIDRYTPSVNLSNYRGSFEDTFFQLADVGTAGCPRSQPLEALRLALDNNSHNAGFLRDDAKLAIVIITAQDDQSPGDLADYSQFVHGLKHDEDDVMIAVAGPNGTCGAATPARLAAFADGKVASLCDDSIIDFIFQNACFPDRDGSVSGICLETTAQPSCAVWDDGGSYPECGDGVATPCWRAASDPGFCGDEQRLSVDRGALDPPNATNMVHVQCIAP